jgi:hypothetical protein
VNRNDRIIRTNLIAGQKKELLLAFSVYSNGKNLLSTKTSGDTLQAVHGIRFITICWVIWGHRYVLDIAVPAINLSIAPDVSSQKSGQRKCTCIFHQNYLPSLYINIYTLFNSAYHFISLFSFLDILSVVLRAEVFNVYILRLKHF